ncbi:MAG: MazG nucleotide pyrophosphohydrolase domain-containing protein [Solirubrobacterales bacterium]
MGDPGGAAEAVGRLDEVTRRLRVECPWDREQDERSIVPHTVEEAYELADAAGSGDDAKMLDELGDVLFQVLFLSLLLEERGSGNLAVVADGCRETLIRRLPHVFGEAAAASASDVLAQWDRIKREVEGRGAGGPFADLPENLPALLYARKLQRRAASRAGGEGLSEDALEAAGRARRALAGLEAAAARGAGGGPGPEPADREAVQRALGEALFATVDAARQLRCDPELALRAEAERFRERHGDGS